MWCRPRVRTQCCGFPPRPRPPTIARSFGRSDVVSWPENIGRDNLSSSTLFLLALRDGKTGVLPGGEPAVDLDDAGQAHLLRDVGGERRAPRPVAVEDELLGRREHVLGIRTGGIDTELEHGARTVEGAGDQSFALELAHVTQIHEHDVVATVAALRLVKADGRDARLGLVDELAKAFLELHGGVYSVASVARRPRW